MKEELLRRQFIDCISDLFDSKLTAVQNTLWEFGTRNIGSEEDRTAILDYTRSSGAQVRLAWDRVQDLIEAAGYDGVIYENTGHNEGEDGSDSYIVFRPEQIKSAVSNNGNFDAASPDIRFSVVDLDEAEDDSETDTEAPCP